MYVLVGIMDQNIIPDQFGIPDTQSEVRARGKKPVLLSVSCRYSKLPVCRSTADGAFDNIKIT